MEDSKKQEGCCMIEENGYVMTITPADSKGSNNVMTILDCRNNASMLVGTILKVPTNASNEACNVYKRKMIHLYETFGICSVSQNPAEFDGTYNKVA